jgi:hypothetical protein
VKRAQAGTRFSLLLIGVFAVIAALLAGVGLYGVLSNAVRQLTAEIGVRMALGATPGSVFKLVVGHGLRLSAIGLAISEPMIVGGAMVEEGEYRIRFDEATGELTVKEKDGDLVASATGEVVQLDDDAEVKALTTTDTNVGRVLTEVQMRNVDKKLILACTCVTDSEGP